MSSERRKQGAGPEARQVGLLIVYLRMREGLLQKDLAEMIGVSDSRLSDWEWGKVYPQGASLDKVAGAFGLERHPFLDLARGLHRYVGRRVEERRQPDIAEADLDDRQVLVERLEEVERKRRDAEADQKVGDETLRRLEREASYLYLKLRLLDGG